MAMMVRFGIHRPSKTTAVFYGGDERETLALPDGWEELVPRDIIRDEPAFDRWIRLELDERLAGLTPPGFRPKKGLRRP